MRYLRKQVEASFHTRVGNVSGRDDTLRPTQVSGSLAQFLRPTFIDDIIDEFSQILTKPTSQKNTSSSSFSQSQHESSMGSSTQDRVLNHLSTVLTSYRNEVQEIVQTCERKEWQLRKEQDILREARKECMRVSKV